MIERLKKAADRLRAAAHAAFTSPPNEGAGALVFDPGWANGGQQRLGVATPGERTLYVSVRMDGGPEVSIEVPWPVVRAALAAHDEDLTANRRGW